MAYSPPLDGFVGYIFLLYAFALGVVAFLMVTVVEIIVLWRLRWGSFLYSLLTSFLMNLASTLVGLLAVYLLAARIGDLTEILGIESTITIFLLLFIASVGIEGGIMLVMKRTGYAAKEIWRLAVITNVISYTSLGAGTFIFTEVL